MKWPPLSLLLILTLPVQPPGPKADCEADVYPAGNCRNTGLTRGYRVRAVDGAILERYSEERLKAIAPPTCPAPIYPTGFWGSDDLANAKAALRKARGG